MSEQWEKEVEQGQRFEFGQNWARYLRLVDEPRINLAVESLQDIVGVHSMEGKRFLDAGCGSGLFSLAARRMGAEVVSIDFDPLSVACAEELRLRYRPNDPQWTVLKGSVLDGPFLEKLGTFDVVYSWGVLHHTGHMWDAVALCAERTVQNGTFVIALYNTQPLFTPIWRRVKRLYSTLPKPTRLLLPAGWAGISLIRGLAVDLATGRSVLARYQSNKALRGMNFWRDIVDWIGGLPFETALPEEVLRFMRPRGFELVDMRTVGGRLGCNEFVLKRTGEMKRTCVE